MLLGYKKRFAPRIESGIKTHTFRGKRKNEPKPGERLYKYTGLRTKNCQKIIGDYFFSGKQKVRMVIKLHHGWDITIDMHIGDKRAWTFDELDEVAKRDGFDSWSEFCLYWLDGNDKVVFSGFCYHWTDFRY